MSNAVREQSRYFSHASLAHIRAMCRVMLYCFDFPIRGKVIHLTRKCENESTFEFEKKGRLDSDFAKDPIAHHSVNGYSIFVEGASASIKSQMQKYAALSVTEAEYGSGTKCVQDMLFTMPTLKSVGLHVQRSMILEMDNKETIGLGNNWSVGGRTYHIDVQHNFLRELKADGILAFRYIPTAHNTSDISTKNVDGTTFNRHAATYCPDTV